jgi:serine/threonine-protein kinase
MQPPVPKEPKKKVAGLPAPTEPQVNATVGPYLLVEQVGKGGQGRVFKALREGRFFVLKFYDAHDMEGWGRRELSILHRVTDENVVRFCGSDRWPDPETGLLYVVMEHVEGLTLDEYTRRFNPSAHRAANLFLTLARVLGRLHAKGILHRDVKRENILVRTGSQEPVLVDFGAADLVGSTTVLKPGELVGTVPYLSPEAWRYIATHREHSQEAYVYTPADEVWALGVTLYWVLTNHLPFHRSSHAAVMQDVLLGQLRPPHELNARAPAALSAVCMRMLARHARDRYADMPAVSAAIEQALARAGASWHLPLFAREAPEAKTTEEIVGKVRRGSEEQEEHLLRQFAHQQQQRETPAVPSPAPHQAAETSVVDMAGLAERVRPLVEPAPRGSRWALPRVLSTFAGGIVPLRPVLAPRGRHLAALLGVLLLGGVVAVPRLMAARETEAPQPKGSPGLRSTPPAGSRHKLELPDKAPDAAARAEAPLEPATPAPAATAAATEAGADVVTHERQGQRKGPGTKVAKSLLGVCMAAGVGCTTTPSVPVRPDPSPEPCPPGAVKTMRELDIEMRREFAVGVIEPDPFKPVREGPLTVMIGDEGRLRSGSRLSGELLFGRNRAHGRLTRAWNKADGKTYTVCFELRWLGDDAPGLPLRERDDAAGTARIPDNTVYAFPVESFR